MTENMLAIKMAIEELSEELGYEIDELTLMVEGTEVEEVFGKKYGGIAWEIFKDFLYSGVDLRLSLIGVANRCRRCSSDINTLEFWSDLAIIINLYEALERDKYYEEKRKITNATKEAENACTKRT